MALLGQVLLALALAVSVAPADTGASPAPEHYEFVWLNAWADHHTRPGGDRAAAMDSGPRMRIVVRHLRRRHADLGVLAEVEQPQRHAFRRLAGPDYALVTSGNTLDNAVYYRRSAFRLVSARTFTTYYLNGQRVRTPVVVLASRATGRRLAVIPVHSPADVPAYGVQARWRQRNLAILTRRVGRLATPVVVAGDFNDETRSVCALTGAPAHLVSPLGPHRGCGRLVAPVDQLYASRSIGLDGYRRSSGPRVRQATDHRHLYAVRISLG